VELAARCVAWGLGIRFKRVSLSLSISLSHSRVLDSGLTISLYLGFKNSDVGSTVELAVRCDNCRRERESPREGLVHLQKLYRILKIMVTIIAYED